MKKYLFLILFIMTFASCALPKIHMTSYSIDLSKYNKECFYITESNSVNFEYDPICLMGTQGGGKQYDKNKIVKLELESVFDKFVNDCKSKGANAVINIKIIQNYSSTENTFYISGMAVKRK